MRFARARLDDWGSLKRHGKKHWLYRGHGSSDWKLESTLERYCRLWPYEGKRDKRSRRQRTEPTEVEKNLTREFKRGFHHYAAHVPAPNATLEWLSLMQHHGAPTRLLDFTYSLYVAAYFAIENMSLDYELGSAAVWCINPRWALRESKKRLIAAGKVRAVELGIPYDEKSDEVFNELFVEPPLVECVCPQNPFRLNERLRTQMGAFMAPGNVSVSFEENLRSLPGHGEEQNVLKLIIPRRLRNDGLRTLFDMGLSRRTLFPGLDGYAESLTVYTPATFDSVPWMD
jgi:hypothetical protein